MRTAEARLAPVSEVSEMEMDMWRLMMESSRAITDEINYSWVPSILESRSRADNVMVLILRAL
jgi:hypothetical protein